jgi:cytochrome c
MRIALAFILTSLATSTLAQPVGDPVRGKQVFETMCTMCHADDGDGQGPSLNGVVGRKAGTGPNFAYTDALKASNLTWTPAALDTFLQGPMQMVPGTAMPQTVPDAAQRADVIAYLATLKP